ncbi:Chromosome segregation in meiosis protein 3 domain-containing protein [Entamoeba marina]
MEQIPSEQQLKFKLSLEVSDLLNESKGLPHLLQQIDTFLANQNDDPFANIQQLLELYKSWATTVKPGVPFEKFLSQLYKLGKKEQIADWIRNEELKGRVDEEEFPNIVDIHEKSTENMDEVKDDIDEMFAVDVEEED